MYNDIITWVFELFKGFGGFMNWLVTPINFNLTDGPVQAGNLNTNGVILESSGNNLARWVASLFGTLGIPTTFTIVPLYTISFSIIIGLLTIGLVKVWFK